MQGGRILGVRRRRWGLGLEGGGWRRVCIWVGMGMGLGMGLGGRLMRRWMCRIFRLGVRGDLLLGDGSRFFRVCSVGNSWCFEIWLDAVWVWVWRWKMQPCLELGNLDLKYARRKFNAEGKLIVNIGLLSRSELQVYSPEMPLFSQISPRGPSLTALWTSHQLITWTTTHEPVASLVSNSFLLESHLKFGKNPTTAEFVLYGW